MSELDNSYDSGLISLPDQENDSFPFMSLPVELRLKIYTYLLPPRKHRIVTQVPFNGYFHTSTTYPMYKVLTANSHASFPSLSMYPHVLRVSKQIREEAEPLLYGAPGVQFDFGTHSEALMAFWGDRSNVARCNVRSLKIAKELPRIGEALGSVDERWTKLCQYLSSQLRGVRILDLTLWTINGSLSSLPKLQLDGEQDQKGLLQRWREWDWTRELLQLGQLRMARITCWEFPEVGREDWQAQIGSCLAARMVSDPVVKHIMVKEGVAAEGVVLVPGLAA